MKIRQVSEIQRNKNKTFSINLNRLINVAANIIDKITNLLFFTFIHPRTACSSARQYPYYAKVSAARSRQVPSSFNNIKYFPPINFCIARYFLILDHQSNHP